MFKTQLAAIGYACLYHTSRIIPWVGVEGRSGGGDARSLTTPNTKEKLGLEATEGLMAPIHEWQDREQVLIGAINVFPGDKELRKRREKASPVQERQSITLLGGNTRSRRYADQCMALSWEPQYHVTCPSIGASQTSQHLSGSDQQIVTKKTLP